MLKLTHVNHLFRLSYGIWLNELKGREMSCAECLRPTNVILKFFNEQMGNYIFIWQETLYSISFLSKKCLE